jgi:hypothetical protein
LRFGEVYLRLLEGLSIRRKAWEPGTFVRFSTIGQKSLIMHRANGMNHVWCPCIDDLYDRAIQEAREDWEVIR